MMILSPVSYTHLDVYKRQVEKQADTAGSVEAMACDLLDNIYFEFDKDVLTAASEKTLDRLAAVSYTHLDVYKRQHQHRAGVRARQG